MKFKFKIELETEKTTKENPTLSEYLDEKGYKVDKSNGNIDIKREVEIFLKKIEYPEGRVSKKAFEKAVELQEINYKSIVNKLKKYFLEFSEEQMEKILKYDSNFWQNQKGHPNADFLELLEYFVNQVKNAK